MDTTPANRTDSLNTAAEKRLFRGRGCGQRNHLPSLFGETLNAPTARLKPGDVRQDRENCEVIHAFLTARPAGVARLWPSLLIVDLVTGVEHVGVEENVNCLPAVRPIIGPCSAVTPNLRGIA